MTNLNRKQEKYSDNNLILKPHEALTYIKLNVSNVVSPDVLSAWFSG